MARGRKQGPPLTHLQVYVTTDLTNKVDLLLMDPARKRVKYGARSALISQLLQEWVDNVEKKGRINGTDHASN